MSCSLPQEITDLIIDHLHNEPTTLRTCCLVSKSWIPRARKYLFAHIKFYPSVGRLVSRWRKTFPDPANSPAHHTRTLSVCNPLLITTADVDTILTFCGVVCLNMDTDLMQDQAVSLVPFHGLSPVMRSLRLTFATLPYSKIFNLILSFPLLEDLVLVSRSRRREDREWSTPSTSSRLTGSLELRLAEGIQPITYRLLDLPNGIHFTKLVVSWISGEDVGSTTDLVSRCSDTLESLDVASYLYSSETPPLDLSEATKLRDVVFRCKRSKVDWVTTALHTVKSKDIQRISLDLSRNVFWQTLPNEWSHLDRLLVQFWALHSPSLKVMYESTRGWEDPRNHVARVLPVLTSREIIDLVEYPYVEQPFPSYTAPFI